MSLSQQEKRLLILVGSPRRNGNSSLLGQAVQEGAQEVGVRSTKYFLDDYLTGFLGDKGTSYADRYSELFVEQFLPADGVVFCTPIYWYGMSAQTKAFFDRSFTFLGSMAERMAGKRVGLVLAAEESYPGAALGIVHQVQEYVRYTGGAFVGFVHGVGNKRGEVARDPSNPILAARTLGREMFTRRYTDYRYNTQRSNQVWQ